MKGAETGFGIVSLSELRGKKVPVKENKPVQAQSKGVQSNRNNGPGSPMGCEEKTRLVREYKVATLAFSGAVNESTSCSEESERHHWRNINGLSEYRVRLASSLSRHG
jgi:hypothetical protein